MGQADHRRDDHREQANRVTIVLTHDTEAFDATNAMFDMHSHTRQLPVRFRVRAAVSSPPRGVRCGVWTPAVPRYAKSACLVACGYCVATALAS